MKYRLNRNSGSPQEVNSLDIWAGFYLCCILHVLVATLFFSKINIEKFTGSFINLCTQYIPTYIHSILYTHLIAYCSFTAAGSANGPFDMHTGSIGKCTLTSDKVCCFRWPRSIGSCGRRGCVLEGKHRNFHINWEGPHKWD